MRDGDGSRHSASGGLGEKWSDSGYILKVGPLGFINGSEHSPLRLFLKL